MPTKIPYYNSKNCREHAAILGVPVLELKIFYKKSLEEQKAYITTLNLSEEAQERLKLLEASRQRDVPLKNAQGRKNRAENRDAVNAKQRARWVENRDAVNARQRKKYKEERDRVSVQHSNHRAKNPEKHQEYDRTKHSKERIKTIRKLLDDGRYIDVAEKVYRMVKTSKNFEKNFHDIKIVIPKYFNDKREEVPEVIAEAIRARCPIQLNSDAGNNIPPPSPTGQEVQPYVLDDSPFFSSSGWHEEFLPPTGGKPAAIPFTPPLQHGTRQQRQYAAPSEQPAFPLFYQVPQNAGHYASPEETIQTFSSNVTLLMPPTPQAQAGTPDINSDVFTPQTVLSPAVPNSPPPHHTSLPLLDGTSPPTSYISRLQRPASQQSHKRPWHETVKPRSTLDRLENSLDIPSAEPAPATPPTTWEEYVMKEWGAGTTPPSQCLPPEFLNTENVSSTHQEIDLPISPLAFLEETFGLPASTPQLERPLIPSFQEYDGQVSNSYTQKALPQNESSWQKTIEKFPAQLDRRKNNVNPPSDRQEEAPPPIWKTRVTGQNNSGSNEMPPPVKRSRWG